MRRDAGRCPLITCKSLECRRLYLLAQSRRNWRTHRDLQRKKAGLQHRLLHLREDDDLVEADLRSAGVCRLVPTLWAVAQDRSRKKGPLREPRREGSPPSASGTGRFDARKRAV